MKKYIFLTVSLVLVSLTLAVLRPSFLETLEGKFYDLHLSLRGGATPSGQVVVVTVDEKSLETFGRWPWPRSLIASVFEKVVSRGAHVLVPDIFFAEPSQGDDAEENDQTLETVLKRSPDILMGYFFLMTPEEVQDSTVDWKESERNFHQIESSALEVSSGLTKLQEPLQVQDTLSRFSSLPGGHRHGFFNILHDADGTLRGTPLLMKFNDKIFPSITLQTLLWDGSRDVPALLRSLYLSPSGEFLVNFRGSRAIQRVNVEDLMDPYEEKNLPSFQDKVILMGATATGLEDNRSTALEAKMPSVFVAASIIDNILTGDILRRDRTTDLVSYLLIVCIGLALGLILPRLKALPGMVLFLVFLALETVLTHYLFVSHHWVLMNVYPLLATVLVYAGVSLAAFFFQEKEKHFITETFSRYLSRDVIRELTDHPEKLRLGGERKELTVFFSDIRDFASIVESTPPEVLVDLLNSYLTPATEVIFQYKGLLDKYIGDAVMAVFGAPLPEPEHPRLACQTAIDTIRMVRRMQETWREEYKIRELKIGVGINTGLMTVGNMGSETRFDYTVMGDAVNLASRIEGLNKYYGTSILVSQHTYEHVRDKFTMREIDAVQVKGKKEILKIYEIPVDPAEEFLGMAVVFRQALEAFRAGRFREARELFEECLKRMPGDGPSALFAGRCREFESQPPEWWNGVTTFLRK